MWNLNQNTPGVKEEWLSTRKKRPCCKRCEIDIGGQSRLLLMDFKVFIRITSLQNIVILGAQGFLMLMVPKFYIMMTRPQNIKWPRPGHLYQQFCSHQYPEAWAPERTMFRSEIITKTFKAGSFGCLFWFHIFFNRAF